MKQLASMVGIVVWCIIVFIIGTATGQRKRPMCEGSPGGLLGVTNDPLKFKKSVVCIAALLLLGYFAH
jgi:hypothetical protein